MSLQVKGENTSFSVLERNFLRKSNKLFPIYQSLIATHEMSQTAPQEEMNLMGFGEDNMPPVMWLVRLDLSAAGSRSRSGRNPAD